MRRLQFAVLAATYLMTISVLSAQAGPGSNQTLQGVTTLGVLIEEVGPTATKIGLTEERLRSLVEAALRKGGVPVVGPERFKANPALPYFYVRLSVLEQAHSPTYVFSISVQFKQGVLLERDPKRSATATTWETGYFGVVGQLKSESIKDSTMEQVDRFINAFKNANP